MCDGRNPFFVAGFAVVLAQLTDTGVVLAIFPHSVEKWVLRNLPGCLLLGMRGARVFFFLVFGNFCIFFSCVQYKTTTTTITGEDSNDSALVGLSRDV